MLEILRKTDIDFMGKCRWAFLFGHDQVLMVRTCGTTGEPSRGMLKKADFSPAQPRRAKTRRSAGKTAASEEAKAYASVR